MNHSNRRARSSGTGEGAPNGPPSSDTLRNPGYVVSRSGPDRDGYTQSPLLSCLLYATSSCGVAAGSFLENETSTVLRITYSTGMKNRLSTVENNIPPTIAVPTECRPNLPAPVAK